MQNETKFVLAGGNKIRFYDIDNIFHSGLEETDEIETFYDSIYKIKADSEQGIGLFVHFHPGNDLLDMPFVRYYSVY